VNLQEAGAQALERCKELVTHADDASKRVDDIDAEVEKINQQLHGDWQHAMERAQQLLARLKAEREELESEADASQALLRDLHGKLAESEQQMVSAVHDLLSEVNAFEQVVEQQEPLLQESLNQVHEKGRSLKGSADDVHGQLDNTSQETEDHLSDDVASALAEITQAHTSRVDQLEEHIQGSSIPEMDQHHEHLHSLIDDHKSAYEESVNTAHEKTQQSATDTLSEATEKHHDVFQQFEQIGNEAKQLMKTLKTGIDTGAETIGAVEEAVKAGVNTTSIGLRAAIGTLEELMKFFQHFSFIKL
jgi:DNA repair exonuclease SbcCD ATPase subunit